MDSIEALEDCGALTYTLQLLKLILLFVSKIWGRQLTHQLLRFFLLCRLAEMTDPHYSYIHMYIYRYIYIYRLTAFFPYIKLNQ